VINFLCLGINFLSFPITSRLGVISFLYLVITLGLGVISFLCLAMPSLPMLVSSASMLLSQPSDLSTLVISNPPTQAELQTVVDKLNELIGGLQTH
jgi:hypothetical protein